MKPLTKALLWVVLGTLVLAALGGITVILTGTSLDWKIIGSLLSVALFGLTSLGASVVASREVWVVPMRVAWGISGVGLALYLGVIMAEPHADGWGQAMGLSAVWAVALPHAGLLALTKFDGPARFARLGAIGSVIALAAMISVMILAEHSAESLWRVMAVMGILTGLGTIGLPVLQKLWGISREHEPESTKTELSIVCPRCLSNQVIQAGKSKCGNCDLRFDLKIEEPRCPKCSYLLYKLASPHCPECGYELSGAGAAG